MEQAKLNVSGMTCQGCVASVTRVLKAIPGVSDVVVTLQPGMATVGYDPAQTDITRLKSAVEDAGYDITA